MNQKSQAKAQQKRGEVIEEKAKANHWKDTNCIRRTEKIKILCSNSIGNVRRIVCQ